MRQLNQQTDTGGNMKIDKSYKEGDTVRYETFTGELRTVRVTAKVPEIKNGKDGFDGVIIEKSRSYIQSTSKEEVWGYDNQIIRVYCKELGRWK
jgi:hypothetical protein